MEPMSENCDKCYNRHITSPATHWCPFCSEGLCSSCTEHHQASKISKYHSLVPISDYHQLPQYTRDIKNCCQEHEQPFQLYCRNHEQCCCLSCAREIHRECKDHEVLSDVIKDVKSSPALEEIEICLKTINDVYDNIRENRKENRSRLAEQKDKIIAEVHNIRKSINDHLDKLVNAIETTILEEFEAANLKINELLTEVEERQKNICQLIEEEETIKRLSTDLQTFLGLPYFQSRIKEETEYIETLQREHRADELDLIFRSNDLDSFCKDKDSFGTVSVSQGQSLIEVDIAKKETAQIILPKKGVSDKFVSNIHQFQYPIRDYETVISSCRILPTGQTLFVDNTNGLLFMRSNQGDDCRDICCISGMFSVTLIENSKAAVTSLTKKQIVIVDLLMGKELNTFSLDDKCWGIEFSRGHFYVKSSGAFLILEAESGNIVKKNKK